MLSRVRGINDSLGTYTGLPILSKDEFYEWSLKDSVYNRLHDDWVKSGYVRALGPSINRKDSALGYLHPNIEWVTTLANCTAALASRTWRPYKNSSTSGGRSADSIPKQKDNPKRKVRRRKRSV